MEKTTLARTQDGIALPDSATPSSTEQQIVDFLAGNSDGAELMLALYGDVANEPLPPRFLEILKLWRTC